MGSGAIQCVHCLTNSVSPIGSSTTPGKLKMPVLEEFAGDCKYKPFKNPQIQELARVAMVHEDGIEPPTDRV